MSYLTKNKLRLATILIMAVMFFVLPTNVAAAQLPATCVAVRPQIDNVELQVLSDGTIERQGITVIIDLRLAGGSDETYGFQDGNLQGDYELVARGQSSNQRLGLIFTKLDDANFRATRANVVIDRPAGLEIVIEANGIEIPGCGALIDPSELLAEGSRPPTPITKVLGHRQECFPAQWELCRIDQGLVCTKYNGNVGSFANRYFCQKQPQTVTVSGSSEAANCVVGGKECGVEGSQQMYCEPDSTNAINGKCDPTGSLIECVDDIYCRRILSNSRGTCREESVSGVLRRHVCVESDSNTTTGTGGPILTELDPSTDFGVRNCPGVTLEFEKDENGNEKISKIFAPAVSDQNYEEYINCRSCLTLGGNWTGFGCVGSSPQELFASLARIALGVMGGVALLRLIYLGFQYQSGDDFKIENARKGVLSTLAAIVLVLFSVLILEILGVNVLDVVPEGFFIG